MLCLLHCERYNPLLAYISRARLYYENKYIFFLLKIGQHFSPIKTTTKKTCALNFKFLTAYKKIVLPEFYFLSYLFLPEFSILALTKAGCSLSVTGFVIKWELVMLLHWKLTPVGSCVSVRHSEFGALQI